MDAYEARQRAMRVRKEVSNKSLPQVHKEVIEEIKQAWRDKEFNITKVVDRNQLKILSVYYRSLLYKVSDVSPDNSLDKETPGALLISWK